MDQFDDNREVTTERVIVVSKMARDVERAISSFEATVNSMKRLHRIYLVVTGIAVVSSAIMMAMLYLILNAVQKQ